jgi:hypothetical protein
VNRVCTDDGVNLMVESFGFGVLLTGVAMYESGSKAYHFQ